MSARGPVLRGLLLAHDIQPKVVAAKSRVHESTLSRFFNGVKDVNDDQYAKICIAIGECMAEKTFRPEVSR